MKKIIAANWKNNGDKKFIKNYFEYFSKNLNNTNKNEIIFFPPDLYMDQIDKYKKQSNFSLGGQTLNTAGSDSDGSDLVLTSGTSSEMYINNGCSYILIGHSEIRQFSNFLIDGPKMDRRWTERETIILALQGSDSLQVIFCVGENEDDKNAGDTHTILSEQLDDLCYLKVKPKKFIVAYEPVWAIGSGKIPTLEDISFIHRFIKSSILEKLSSLKEKDIMVLYGGSVNLKNAKDILCAPHVDGVLIGGASLKVKEFTSICNLKI
jgi:triosephosphate isomerase